MSQTEQTKPPFEELNLSTVMELLSQNKPACGNISASGTSEKEIRFNGDDLLVFILWGIAFFFLACYITSLLLHILSLIKSWTRWYNVKRMLPPDVSEWPSVSIIKPLCGVDNQLSENLETFFTLDYPGQWELLICVEHLQDPAVNVVLSLMEKYSNVDAKLFRKEASEETTAIINPMIRNSLQGYENAKYDFIWISCARLRGGGEMLKDMVARACTPNVGLVHQVPYVWAPNGAANSLSRHIERMHFAIATSRATLAIWALGFTCITGMSFIFPRRVLEKAGSLRAFACYLAEDYRIAKAVDDLGYRLEVAAIPAMQNTGAERIMYNLINRMIRWHQLRISAIPFKAIVIEPFQYCFITGVSAGWALHYLFNVEPSYFLIAHTVGWFCSDTLLFHAGHRKSNSLSSSCFPCYANPLKFVMAWITLQFIPLYVALVAIINYPYVNWGTTKFKLSKETLAKVAE